MKKCKVNVACVLACAMVFTQIPICNSQGIPKNTIRNNQNQGFPALLNPKVMKQPEETIEADSLVALWGIRKADLSRVAFKLTPQENGGMQFTRLEVRSLANPLKFKVYTLKHVIRDVEGNIEDHVHIKIDEQWYPILFGSGKPAVLISDVPEEKKKIGFIVFDRNGKISITNTVEIPKKGKFILARSNGQEINVTWFTVRGCFIEANKFCDRKKSPHIRTVLFCESYGVIIKDNAIRLTSETFDLNKYLRMNIKKKPFEKWETKKNNLVTTFPAKSNQELSGAVNTLFHNQSEIFKKKKVVKRLEAEKETLLTNMWKVGENENEQIDVLNVKINELNKKITSLENSNKGFSEKFEMYIKKHDRACSDISNKLDTIIHLMKEIQDNIETNNKCKKIEKKDLSSLKHDFSALEKEMNSYHKILFEIKTELEGWKKNVLSIQEIEEEVKQKNSEKIKDAIHDIDVLQSVMRRTIEIKNETLLKVEEKWSEQVEVQYNAEVKKIERASQEITNLTQQVSDLQTKISNKESDNTQLTEQIARVCQELVAQQKVLTEAKEKLGTLTGLNEQQQVKIRELTSVIDTKEQIITTQTKAIEKVQVANQKLTQEKLAVEKQYQTQVKKVNAATRSIETLNQQVSDLQTKISNKESDNAQLTKTITQISQDLVAQKSALFEAKKKLSTLTGVNATQQAKIRDLTSVIDTKEQIITTQTKAIEKVQVANQKLTQEKDSLQKKFSQERSNVERLSAQIQRLNKSIQVLEKLNASGVINNEKLQKDIVRLQGLIHDKQGALDDSLENVKRLSKETENAHDQYQKQGKNFSQLLEQIDVYKKQINQSGNTLKETQELLAQSDDEKQRLNQQFQKEQKRRRELEQKNEELKKQLEKKEKQKKKKEEEPLAKVPQENKLKEIIPEKDPIKIDPKEAKEIKIKIEGQEVKPPKEEKTQDNSVPENKDSKKEISIPPMVELDSPIVHFLKVFLIIPCGVFDFVSNFFGEILWEGFKTDLLGVALNKKYNLSLESYFLLTPLLAPLGVLDIITLGTIDATQYIADVLHEWDREDEQQGNKR